MHKLTSIALLVILGSSLPCPVMAESNTGFLVAAPDRGFAGNETVRDAFSALAEKRNAELVFVTDERGRPYMDQALSRLARSDIEEIIVLPLFISNSNPRFQLLQSLLDSTAAAGIDVSLARPFGESYFAVEMLADRVRKSSTGLDQSLTVAGYGAEDESTTAAMADDWRQIVTLAGRDLGLQGIDTVIFPHNRAPQSDVLEASVWEQVSENATIVPLHIGGRLDAMMSVDNTLRRKAPDGVTVKSTFDDEEAYFTLWMQREANRHATSRGELPGVVFLAHGADFHWNEVMRGAAKDLTQKYDVEFAFSMADAPSIRRAVKRLEERGASSAVVVRVFGMPDSFLTGIERLIGQDVESPDRAAPGNHGSINMGPPPPRLHTPLMVTTAGGLADHPLFARALLDRALDVSNDPAKETVIIAAHGQGGGDANERWLAVLESLTTQIKAMGGEVFRDVIYQTWQEDWDDDREERIESVRSMVEAAQSDDGVAIVVAARTTGYGPTDDFLEGMTYKKAPGFAPHPLFAEWLEAQVESGIQQIRESVIAPIPVSSRRSH